MAKKHGHTSGSGVKSRTYNSWNSMKYRCVNPRGPMFRYFGGRGIKVCDRWLHSFENFLADMGLKPKGTKLDRRDKDDDYEPDNCRWAVIPPKRPRSNVK